MKKYKNDSIYMVLGQDILSTVHKWKKWNQIKSLVNIVCVSRPGYTNSFNGEIENISFIDKLDLDISSSMIRDKILSDNKDKAEQYKSGKDKLFGFFVGQVMKESGGKANPQLVNEILKKKLK